MLQNISSKQSVAVISSKGQITLPVSIRKHMGVGTSDKVAFETLANGTALVTQVKYPDIKSLRGAAGTLKKPLTWKKMREIALRDRLKEKYAVR